ncbi:host attachment family protein [Glacieibacterium megasporae]|uniref:host attachment family protein n=1 Tax=Glacieibacterium megasporae TaxID=2835787 RepID=UPI002102D30A|nr:host attachment protein [Polymorphobacter megasporae]
MLLAHGTIVAVADGEKLTLFRNGGSDSAPKLTAIGTPGVGEDNIASGGRHHSSSANPDDAQLVEDGHAGAVASLLNKMALEGEIDALVVVAPPKTLGELRKHWHKVTEGKIAGEVAKEMTGASITDITAMLEKA